MMAVFAEYEAHKGRADEANARKEQLFEEAKHLGGIGDRSADSHLRQLENRIKVKICVPPNCPIQGGLSSKPDSLINPWSLYSNLKKTMRKHIDTVQDVDITGLKNKGNTTTTTTQHTTRTVEE